MSRPKTDPHRRKAVLYLLDWHGEDFLHLPEEERERQIEEVRQVLADPNHPDRVEARRVLQGFRLPSAEEIAEDIRRRYARRQARAKREPEAEATEGE